MKFKINKYLLYFLQFLIFIVLFYILFNSSVNLVIFPFAFGMFFALAWANQKLFLLVPSYFIAGIIHDTSWEMAICLVATIFCLVVPYFIHVLCKKNMKKWEFGIFAVLSQIGVVVFDILNGFSPILCIAYMILGVLFMYACIIIFEAIIIRGFTNKLTNVEIVSLFSIIAIVCGGLTLLNIEHFSFLKLFMCFILLIFSYCSTPLLTLLVASVGGIGSLISTNNPLFVVPFIVWGLSALLFKKKYRILMVLAVISIELLLGYYFKLYSSFGIIEMLPVLISSLLFLIIPNKVCSEISTIFNLSKDRLAMKNVVNRNREILHNRLGNLSEIFNDINQIYRNLIKQNMTFEDVQSILQQEIVDKICSYCPERNHCHRTFADNTKKVFDELIKISFEKGKSTLLDVPSYLTSRCKQTNSILGSINTLTAQYKKYIGMVHDVDTSKLIIADQLLGVSKIMKTLSKEVETGISFDTARENKIIDELTYYNIICIDAVVFEKDEWTQNVSLVVRNEDSERKKIESCVSKVCGKKMTIYEKFSSTRPGYCVINLQTAPKYDCIFGVSQKTKNGSKVSGDTYSVIKLDGNKLLFAINDGMGSGVKAEQTSELSISLIENFYKAGFDNEIILSTVNKLLNLHKDDIFSALDICVLDEKNGLLDFIKMASPKSYLLNEDCLKEINTGALPIGIVENPKPLVNKQVISAKDFVIMISDGISDSFENDEELSSCIKSIKTRNPQEFADELVERALSCNNGYAVDDMTAIVVKILDF